MPGDSKRGGPDKYAAWLIIPLAALLTIILVVFYGLYQTSTVEGGSMLPNLRPGDKMLATKGYSAPIRGEIVLLHRIDAQGVPHDVVKRIIAIPGDTIEIRDDVAWVNGAREPDVGQLVAPAYGVSIAAQRVPPGRVYVMGDNRPVSLDSRDIGTLPAHDIQGRVKAIWAPINRIRHVN
jgi:signal peptidase I